jgi:hypothetical protein
MAWLGLSVIVRCWSGFKNGVASQEATPQIKRDDVIDLPISLGHNKLNSIGLACPPQSIIPRHVATRTDRPSAF